MSPARVTALKVLCAVDEDAVYANLELNRRLRTANLSAADAAFATELVGGTLRMQLFYDAVLSSVAKREVDSIDVLTRNVLRMGIHQLLSLNTPSHAAVNEGVALQRMFGKASATGFVNAILRAVSRKTSDEYRDELIQGRDAESALELRYGHPQWIIRALRQSLAAEGRAEELEALLAANNVAPKVQLVFLPGTSDADQLRVSDSDSVEATGPSPIGLVLAKGAPGSLIERAGLATPGMLRVQDQGSQLAALALLHATSHSPGEEWLDLCAGPGGKTAILAATAELWDTTVRAVEPTPHRSELVRQAVDAFHHRTHVVVADGTSEDAFEHHQYDRILVDAPCTGLGALRRRPEARLRKQPTDVAGLTALQSRLLDAALQHVKRGGVVAYVTCSPHLAETRGIVDNALRQHPQIEELDAKSVLQEISRVHLDFGGQVRSAQLWPHRHGTDAMFIALLQRRLDV